MKKTPYILLALSVAGIQALSAQTGKNDTIAKRSIVIERDYIPTIKDVKKPEVTPVITEPEIKRAAVTYSDKVTLLEPAYEPNRWQAAATRIEPARAHKGYALLGIGFYGTGIGDLLCPIVDDATRSLTLEAHALALFGNKQQKLVTNFGLDYKHSFEHLDLNIGTYFKRTGFNYYGSPYLTGGMRPYKDSTNHFVNFGVYAGIKSRNDKESTGYALKVQYNNFTPGVGVREQQIHTTGNIEVPLAENRLGLDADVRNLIYSGSPDSAVTSHAIIGLAPYFALAGESWKVRIGFKDYIATGGGEKKINLMPDISAQINLINTVTVYGGITGEYSVNTFEQTTSENSYINMFTRPQNSYAPFDFYGGIKTSPLPGWTVNGSVDYKTYKKQYFYVNSFYLPLGPFPANIIVFPTVYPWFETVADKADLLTAALNTSYNWRDQVNVHFGIRYNDWNTKTLEHAWMRPATEVETGAEVKLNQHLFVNANYYFAGGRYASGYNGSSSVKMNNISDLSLGASYSYSDWLTAFVRFNNVLGCKYQTWFGYDALRTNMQIGAAFTF
jgi:hypothetical protein